MKTAYKLFDISSDGKLYPLFIGNKKETPIGVLLTAEDIPTKGFAHRPGWHVGAIPSAPWLMNANGEYKSRRGKNWKRLWFKVEYNNNNDYTQEALKQPKKCFQEVPVNGFYTFFEKGRCLWYICSDIKIIGVLDEEERQIILKQLQFDEKAEFEPYKHAFEKRKITNKRRKQNEQK